MTNYDLFMANFNSLSKRMGELRENAFSQGAWARVFNGGLSNDLGLGTSSNYTTIQAGYDYALGFEGANNYIGVALSYALSSSKTKADFVDITGKTGGLRDISSNAIEFAVYNSYVGDGVNVSELNSENWASGFYNDSIAKFAYISSSFSTLATGSNTYDTNNLGFVFSNEVGYKLNVGESNEWGITPQFELGFGYLNQSDFKQVLSKHDQATNYLEALADSVLNVRSRIGSNFSYDFKNFIDKDNNMKASVYLGTYYEYDVISGGDITLSTDKQNKAGNVASNLESNGRFVLNVGSNVEVQDATRIYFDFEKSFGGKINTDYQVNFGVRYSFGENTEYKPVINTQESKEISAPIKVKEVEEVEKGKEVEGKEDKEGSKEVGGEEESKEEAKSE